MKKEKSELMDSFKNPITKHYLTKSKYINRELSWLEFNKRVLYQVMRKEIPLIERCNFLSITTSNLDEFIMVRLATVKNRMMGDKSIPELSGLYPFDEYTDVMKGVQEFKKMQDKVYNYIITKFKKHNIELCKYKDLSKDEKAYLGKIFYKNIFPVLTPINYDTTKEFPDLDSKQSTIVVSVEDSRNNNLEVISFIPLNDSLDKIYEIPTKGNSKKYITLEELIYGYLEKIYFNKKITDYGCMKILREADIEVSHNRDVYITDRMRKTIQDRKYSPIIFMDVTGNVSKGLQKILLKIFELDKRNLFAHDNNFNYNHLCKIPIEGETYQAFTPQYPGELIGEYDIFSAIDNGDILLHHPYESYDPIVKFLEHSANDANVLSIKQTLYRVSSIDSPIINALCMAAKNGKHVAVILEIKARFDEATNISLIEKLRYSGVKLIYGTEDLKTHCKFISVVRKSKKGLKIYSHLGTGNYNDKTAKLYTDISYFTSDFKTGQDLISIFNMLSGFSEPNVKINKLFFSPYNLRKRLMNGIDNEIKHAKNGKTAVITFKINSLSDKEVIDKLYEASKAGVQIMIFCRGVCSLKPINKNITVRAIVGRYLEHSRIYYFYNNKNSEVYISSADLLTRNLDKRFELLIPIKEEETKTKLLKILSMYYKDTFNSYEMNSSGEYNKLKGDCDIHQLFMDEAIDNYKLKSIPKLIGKHKNR